MLHRQLGRRATILGLSVVLAAASLAPAQAQDQAEMEAYMALAEPGPHHKMLVERAGTYKTTSKMWMDPSAPPMETVGTSNLVPILDGRFVKEVTKAPMMGMPWEGHGIFGYNNGTKKHEGVWFDTFGTLMMKFEGTCKDHCKMISMSSTYYDPVSKMEKTMKTVSEQKTDDMAVTTLYDVIDGKDVKMAVITYERTSKTATRE